MIRLYPPLGWCRSDENGRVKNNPAVWVSKVRRVRLYEAASPGLAYDENDGPITHQKTGGRSSRSPKLLKLAIEPLAKFIRIAGYSSSFRS